MSDKKPFGLTVQQAHFFLNVVRDRMKKVDAWELAHPRSKASRAGKTEQACRDWRKIREHFGGEKKLFEAAGLGTDRIIQVLGEALEAEKLLTRAGEVYTTPDHNTRLKAVHELKEIHGLNEQHINISEDRLTPAARAANRAFVADAVNELEKSGIIKLHSEE